MMFLWIGVLAAVVFFLVRPGFATGGCGVRHAYVQTPADADVTQILRQRLARGEITPEQFEQIRTTLGR